MRRARSILHPALCVGGVGWGGVCSPPSYGEKKREGANLGANEFSTVEATIHRLHGGDTQPGCCRGWMADVYMQPRCYSGEVFFFFFLPSPLMLPMLHPILYHLSGLLYLPPLLSADILH